MKFNAVETLISQHGYTRMTEDNGTEIVTKTYERVSDVLWYGPMHSEMVVKIRISSDCQTLRVCYYAGYKFFKAKTHLNDKHAYNAIRDTLAHHSFEI